MTELSKLLGKLKCNENGCWIWQGCSSGGYGCASVEGKNQRVHRAVYALMVEEVPAGLDVHHTCGEKLCANPQHLVPMTRSDHLRTAPPKSKRQRYCQNGHEYTPENTRMDPRGNQRCRICEKANYAREYARQRERYQQYAADYRKAHPNYMREWRERKKREQVDGQ